ncbi:MAG: dihydrodipicolinate synthase family protein [Paenibacillaceae bacterium]
MWKFRGIYPVLAIPFYDNGEVDQDSLRREIDFVLEQGVDGLVIFGLASEIYKLSERERITITDVVVSHVNGAVPVIAGTEHTGSEVAVERSYIAEEQGVSGVMVYPPTFVKPDVAGIKEYYFMISDRIRIPIMIQDAQAWTQVPLPADLIADLAALQQVRYVKIETVPTGPKISKVLEKTNGSIDVFGGYGGMYYVDEMERGAVGTLIPVSICDQFVAIHRAFHSGDVDTAIDLHQRLLPFLVFEMTSLDVLIEIQKILLHRAGIFATERSRRPHTGLDLEQRKTLSRFLNHYSFNLLLRTKKGV